jgi:hypothetical protein
MKCYVKLDIVTPKNEPNFTISNLCLDIPELSLTQATKDIVDKWLDENLRDNTVEEYTVTFTPR